MVNRKSDNSEIIKESTCYFIDSLTELGILKKDLARVLGIAPKTLSNWSEKVSYPQSRGVFILFVIGFLRTIEFRQSCNRDFKLSGTGFIELIFGLSPIGILPGAGWEEGTLRETLGLEIEKSIKNDPVRYGLMKTLAKGRGRLSWDEILSLISDHHEYFN